MQGNVTVDETHSYATAESLSPFFDVFFSKEMFFFVLMFLRVLVYRDLYPVNCCHFEFVSVLRRHTWLNQLRLKIKGDLVFRAMTMYVTFPSVNDACGGLNVIQLKS